MSVVHVQASALDVGSNFTIQRLYNFFEILEIIFAFMQDIFRII